MSIDEGYKAVHSALFGFDSGQHLSKGVCGRCGVELRLSPVDGNCQPNCRFRFGTVDGLPVSSMGIFNGACCEFEWTADLCDACVGSLTQWLYGKGNTPAERRYREWKAAQAGKE